MGPWLVRIMACNADDGASCNVAGMTEMRQAFQIAVRETNLVDSAATEEYFRIRLRRACLGSPDKPPLPARPAGAPFANFEATVPIEGTISTIVTLATLVRLISEPDRERFEREHSVRFTASTATARTVFDEAFQEMMIERLAAIPPIERLFRLAEDEAHGRPYVWFTAKADLDAALARVRLGVNQADKARDLLGLVHHGPVSRDHGGPNQLVALHLPAKVAATAGHLRPGTPQAFDNMRFVQRFEDEPAPPSDWGRTLELDLFASSLGHVPAGGRERVLLRLQAGLLDDGMTIGFDLLGPVSTSRGLVGHHDDDEAFVAFLGRRRNVDALVRTMCR